MREVEKELRHNPFGVGTGIGRDLFRRFFVE